MATPKKTRQPGTKQKALAYFIAHVGEIIDNRTLREAIGATSDSWTRRVRELRTQDGYKIRTIKDRSDLRSDQYILEDLERLPTVVRNISRKTRALVLDRDSHMCQSCGVGPGDIDSEGRLVKLHMGHVVDVSHGGTNDAGNLKTLCSPCNEGISNLSPPRENRSQLIGHLRRARPDDQLEAYEWLKKRFGK